MWSSKTQANVLLLVQAVHKEIQCAIAVSKRVYSQKNPVLRSCSYCLGNELTWIELAILCISMDSEARNQNHSGHFQRK